MTIGVIPRRRRYKSSCHCTAVADIIRRLAIALALDWTIRTRRCQGNRWKGGSRNSSSRHFAGGLDRAHSRSLASATVAFCMRFYGTGNNGAIFAFHYTPHHLFHHFTGLGGRRRSAFCHGNNSRYKSKSR